MAMGRLNRPSLMIYGGTIRAGHHGGQKLDIVSAFQSYGEYIAGRIDEETRQAIVRHSCPGAGRVAACTPPTPWLPPSKRWA
jgi:dihydroxy-acid dehydratase